MESELREHDRGQDLLIGSESSTETPRQFVTVGDPWQGSQAASLHDRPDAISLLFLLLNQRQKLFRVQPRIAPPRINDFADMLEAKFSVTPTHYAC